MSGNSREGMPLWLTVALALITGIATTIILYRLTQESSEGAPPFAPTVVWAQPALDPQGSTGSVEAAVQQEIRAAAAYYGLPAEKLLRIADCESDFLPWAISRNGQYVGVYQFTIRTWVWARDAAGFPDADRLDYVANVWVAAWLMRVDGYQHWSCR